MDPYARGDCFLCILQVYFTLCLLIEVISKSCLRPLSGCILLKSILHLFLSFGFFFLNKYFFLSYIFKFQLNSMQSENHKELPESIFSSARTDSDNAFNLQDISISRTSTSIRNGTQSQPSSVSLNDLILNLYSISDKTPVDSTSKATGNGTDSAQTFLASDLIDDVDNDSWEFKDAVSEMVVEVQKTSISSIGDSLQTFPTKSKLKVYMDFYCKLKDELCFIALGHLESLKVRTLVNISLMTVTQAQYLTFKILCSNFPESRGC